MKKSLIITSAFVAVVGIGAMVMAGCQNKEKGWGENERKELRKELRHYRDMIYVDNLSEVEFDSFTGDVIEAIEVDYPIYTTFYELPARGDTLDVYVVSTIVERLDTDPHNIRNIFPYPWLVAEGILPANLDHQAQRAFYDCFAHKVKRHWHTSRNFLNAIVNDPTAPMTIYNMQMACSAELFDWGIEVEETVELTPTN